MWLTSLFPTDPALSRFPSSYTAAQLRTTEQIAARPKFEKWIPLACSVQTATELDEQPAQVQSVLFYELGEVHRARISVSGRITAEVSSAGKVR